jgi:hypothetical protein
MSVGFEARKFLHGVLLHCSTKLSYLFVVYIWTFSVVQTIKRRTLE